MEKRENDFNVVVTGDFNFPERIVKWISSDEGIFADASEGIMSEKVAFQIHRYDK